MRTLFQRVGWSVGSNSFETGAAIDVEATVRADIYRRTPATKTGSRRVTASNTTIGDRGANGYPESSEECR